MHLLKLFFLFVVYNLFISIISAQTIRIEASFNSDTIIAPFPAIDSITGLSIDADISLLSDTSLVRVILNDNAGGQYMLLEAYPLISSEYNIEVSNHCDETCYLDRINPDSLKIHIINAEIMIDNLIYQTESNRNMKILQYAAKQEKDEAKVIIMNNRIKDYEMEWNAGDNSMLRSYYSEKADIFGEKYNLLGYDYYTSGKFRFLSQEDNLKGSLGMVRQFDWRSRHGANDPLSPYWDSDTLGSGWLTSVQDQGGCYGCWAFSTIGVIEAMANLYSNNHIDYDLSEQDIISCSGAGNCSNGGNHLEAMVYVKDTGVMTEACFNYDTTDTPCTSVYYCSPPLPLITAHDTSSQVFYSPDSIRKKLILNGPLAASVNVEQSKHSMVLTGFEIDPIDSVIYWIFKNSWGYNDSLQGYRIMATDNIDGICGILPPIYRNDTVLTVACRDEDDDGYCFWGIGSKPENCDCPDTMDCDDNNPLVGGYDEDFNCSCLLVADTSYLIISSDTTWCDSIYVKDMILVDSGATLTISCYAAFGNEAGIIVEQGGELVIDSGYLTRACNDLWWGIEVWGSDTSQAFLPYFGKVSIINGSVIEFAEVGVANHCRLCDHYMVRSGGIIYADSSIFRNNITSISFESFRNMHFGNEYPYQASFKECSFVTTSGLYEFAFPQAHLMFKEVYGVSITSCNFTNTYKLVSGFFDRGAGILSYDGHFSIKNQCKNDSTSPCPEYDSCHFVGLEYGIKAVFDGIQRTLSIRDLNFSGNIVGISLLGINNASITGNRFYCKTARPGTGTCRFLGGAFLEGCSAYQIEENQFIGRSDTSFFGDIVTECGLGIKNSGTEDNLIYNNAFSNLRIGIAVIGENRGREGGLCIKCNDMRGNINDFIVAEEDEPPSGSFQGIAYYQGTLEDEITAPAGNIFTAYDSTQIGNPINLENWNYFNEADTIRYIHHNSNYSYIAPSDSNYTNETIFLTEQEDLFYSKNVSCPSLFRDTNYLKSSSNPFSVLWYADLQIYNLDQQLLTLVDGGDTEALNFDVLLSLPDEALQLRQQLLDESPYLSDTVMKQAIFKESVLSNAMLRDILVANPQAAKKNEVLNYLNIRQEPMPDYLLAEINEGNEYFGAKEILESKKQFWKTERTLAKNSILRSYVLDTTIINPFDSLIVFYLDEPGLQAQYDLAFSYYSKRNLPLARSVIDEIPLHFDFNGYQDALQQDYENFFDILTVMNDSSWNATAIDSMTVVSLYEIMDHNLPLISSYARGLLMKGEHTGHMETIMLPGYYKYSNILKKPDKYKYGQMEHDHLMLFPNPANTTTTLYFAASQVKNQALSILITDISGNLVKSFTLSSFENQVTLNLKGIAAGVYIVNLINGQTSIQSRKLLIIK